MTVYLKKTWGFSDPCGPLQFSRQGARDNARDALQPGDLVVIVGTKGDETAPEDQGLILGLMEPSRIPVAALDYALAKSENHFDDKGNYRWPFGLELVRAWRFDAPRRPLEELTRRIEGRMGALTVVPLLSEEADAILALPRMEVPLLQPARVAARIHGHGAVGRHTAPPPSTTRSGVMHLRRAKAYTYAMKLIGAKGPAYKVGWAFDYRLRQRQFNRASLPGLGGIRYEIAFTELWDTATLAFRMEQRLLRHFSELRNDANGEVVGPLTEGTLQAEWMRIVLQLRREAAKPAASR